MKKGKKNLSGLKKWNKIVSILVKDYKKRGQSYDIKEVRRLASSVYSDFKEVAPSKLKVTQVKKSAEKEIRLEAVDVPDYWFDNQQNFTYWFQVGEWANRFANAYPTIPIMLITKGTKKQPLVVQGATGDYDGSIFQKWTEDIRDSLENPDESDSEVGYFFGTPAYKDKTGQIYAVWFEDGVKIPKIPPKATKIEPRKALLISEREDIEKKRREIEKPPKKRGRPKKTEEEKKKTPLPKKTKKPIKEKEKPQANRVTEIRNLIADLRQDLKEGLITKKFYQEEVRKLTDKLDKGGLI